MQGQVPAHKLGSRFQPPRSISLDKKNVENFNNYYNDLIGINNILKILLFIFLALIIFLIVSLRQISNQPTVVPHVIYMYPNGETQYVGPIGSTSQKIPLERASYDFVLNNFITRGFSLSSDIKVVNDNMQWIYAFMTSTATPSFEKYLEEEEIAKIAGQQRIDVKVDSILNVKEDIWQLDFTQMYSLINGNYLKTVKRRAIVTLYNDNIDFSKARYNSYGLYIRTIDMQIME